MRRLLLLLFLLPLNLYAQGAGTPPYRGVNNWNLIFGTDNTYDIGASGATRPRTGYFGTSVVTPALTVSGLTSGRVTFASTGGLLADDADLTFATDRLTADKLTVTTGPLFVAPGTAANPGIASTALTTTGFLLGAINYSVRSGVEWVGMSGSGATGSIRICTSGSAGCGTQETIEATTAGIRWTDLILTAATMTAESTGVWKTSTHSYTWTNAQVVALGATTSGDINVATLPAKTQVVDALVVITGTAAGPTTVTVQCGDTGTFINYVVAADAKVAANTVYGDAVAERGTALDAEFWHLPSYTGTTTVACRFISTGANLSTVTGSTGRVILTTRLLP
jgi:hypothetical protein